MSDKLELEILKALKEERDVSDKRYAIKLIETIVFALVGILCVGVIGALLRLII